MKRSRSYTPAERLEMGTERIPGISCHIWTGATYGSGYGQLKVNGKQVGAHRLAYELSNGPVGHLHVLHRCDVRCCVNPDHLFLGTNADNVADKISKGRAVNPPRLLGAQHSQAKLTESDVLAINEMLCSGRSQREIGQMFGVGQQSISRINRGHLWSHVLKKGKK